MADVLARLAVAALPPKAVESRSGAGVLDKVDYVVRISTEGGVPPDELPASERETARVNYRAIYLFLQKAG